jgi:hypothetical protein
VSWGTAHDCADRSGSEAAGYWAFAVLAHYGARRRFICPSPLARSRLAGAIRVSFTDSHFQRGVDGMGNRSPCDFTIHRLTTRFILFQVRRVRARLLTQPFDVVCSASFSRSHRDSSLRSDNPCPKSDRELPRAALTPDRRLPMGVAGPLIWRWRHDSRPSKAS